MKKLLFLALALALVGCSTASATKQAFRNRENDYIHQTVNIQGPLVTPPGLSPIKTNPNFTIPPGPASYPPEPKAVNLQPPTLSA